MRLGPSTIAVALVAALVSAGPAAAAPSGSAKSYAVTPTTDRERYGDGRPADVLRWNPCAPISYKVNPGALGAAGVAEVQRAMTLAARGSGLQFRYAGTTSWVPTLDRDGRTAGVPQSVGVPLVVGYATVRQTQFFGRAVGRASISSGSSSVAREQIQSAAAFTRTDARLAPGFGSGASRGGVVLHEVGHALGLDHVGDRSQIMYPVMLRHISGEYQRGDLAGLKRVGRSAGCILPVPVVPVDTDEDGVPDASDPDPYDATIT